MATFLLMISSDVDVTADMTGQNSCQGKHLRRSPTVWRLLTFRRIFFAICILVRAAPYLSHTPKLLLRSLGRMPCTSTNDNCTLRISQTIYTNHRLHSHMSGVKLSPRPGRCLHGRHFCISKPCDAPLGMTCHEDDVLGETRGTCDNGGH